MFRVLIGAFALLTVVGCGGRDGSSANIPIDPLTCVELVSDECVPEVIEAFCEDCDLEATYNEGYGDGFAAASELCDIEGSYLDGYNAGYAAGYDAGFADGVESVVCECPTWPPEDACSEPSDAPPGHLIKECRGRPDKD